MRDLFSIMDSNDIAAGVRWRLSYRKHGMVVVVTDCYHPETPLERTGEMHYDDAKKIVDAHNEKIK